MGVIKDTIQELGEQFDQLIDKENARHKDKCRILFKAQKAAIEGLQATCEHLEYRILDHWSSGKRHGQYMCCNECNKNLGSIPEDPVKVEAEDKDN